MRFNRPAFVEILDRSGYATRKAFAERVGISPGALHDVISGRRNPSKGLIQRLASELRAPLPSLLLDPEAEAEAS